MALMKQKPESVEGYEEDEEAESIGEELPEPRVLKLSEAQRCLHTIGKAKDGISYVYLAINLCNRNLLDVSLLTQFKCILYVDVSVNRLTSEHFTIFSSMKQLLMLKADENLLDSIDSVVLPNLQVLSLNKNQLIFADPSRFKKLQLLELNYNNIQAVTWAPFYNLKKVELRGNELITSNIFFSKALTHLFLAENKIEHLQIPPCLENLEVLHVRSNKISSLNEFNHCKKLFYLNLRSNNIYNISELIKLRDLTALQTLVLLENPAFERKPNGEMAYIDTILMILPQLLRIDKTQVAEANRATAKVMTDWMSIKKLDGKSFSVNNSYYDGK